MDVSKSIKRNSSGTVNEVTQDSYKNFGSRIVGSLPGPIHISTASLRSEGRVRSRQTLTNAGQKDHAPLLLSCRLLLSTLAFVGFYLMYTIRFDLQLAVKYMVNQTAFSKLDRERMNKSFLGELRRTHTLCHVDDTKEKQFQHQILWELGITSKGSYEWSSEMQENMKTSFLWSYLLTQVPGGWFAERYGGKHLFGLSMLVGGFMTMLTPLMLNYFAHYAVFAQRIIIGITQGVMIPAMNSVLSRWTPPRERHLLLCFVYSGAILSLTTNNPLSVAICEGKGSFSGWPTYSIFIGCLAVAWSAAWEYLVHNSPLQHPRISESERLYISNSFRNTPVELEVTPVSIPWKSILTSSAVWAYTLANVCMKFNFYRWINLMPNYMFSVLGYQRIEAENMTSIPYLLMLLTLFISAFVFIRVVNRKCLSRTQARKVGTAVAFGTSACLYLWASFVSCADGDLGLDLLFTCVALQGLHYGAGFLTGLPDIAPQFQGVIFGFTNTLATISAAVSLSLGRPTGFADKRWKGIFYESSAMACAGALIYVFIGSSELQPWSARPDLLRLPTPSLNRRSYLDLATSKLEEDSKLAIGLPGSDQQLDTDQRQALKVASSLEGSAVDFTRV